MQARWIETDASIGAQRGQVVVGLSALGTASAGVESLQSVLAHTGAEVPIVVCGDPESDQLDRVDAGAGRVLWRAATIEAAVAAAAPADFALLGSPCIVGAGWLDGLRAAAYADSTVATSTALTEDGRIGRPETMSFDEAASVLAASAVSIRPRLPAAGRHCVYFRRSALELAGGLDGDFSARCVSHGLCHLLADDVLVLPRGNSADCWPEATGPLNRSLAAARRAFTGLRVVIDARIVNGPTTGTRVHVLELIAALGRTGQIHVTALVTPDLRRDERALLESLPGVVLATDEPASNLRADLVHRPFQISAPADLTLLARLGDRLVITHQDLISYHSPSYFPSHEAWHGYRRLTRDALAVADQVLFFSAHARDDALAEDLVDRHRASVIQIGVDHPVTGSGPADPIPPPGAERLTEDAQMILCLGTDYSHKNRIFALRMLDELKRRHGWSGWLVLAGPHVAFGSSRDDEQRFLGQRPELAKAVLGLNAVTEAEKTWLMRRASLVVYPTVHEGFGLIPFEAADNLVPSMWAPGTAISELLPDTAAGIVPWDAGLSADRALALIGDEETRASNLEVVRNAAGSLMWDAAAARLLELYRSVCSEPAALGAVRERTAGLMNDGLSEDAVRLVGPAGALPRDLERPLLALATHPRVGGPVFGAIRYGYRAWTRLRRGGS